jgi:hypothetical protein
MTDREPGREAAVTGLFSVVQGRIEYWREVHVLARKLAKARDGRVAR